MPSAPHRLALFLVLFSPVWSLCPAGHVQQGSNLCQPCALGTFSTGGLASTCTPCPHGSTSQHAGAASRLECQYCLDGFAYRPHAESPCTPCHVSGKSEMVHQRQQCEREPFGGNPNVYRDWGFSNIDRALQEIQGDRGMLKLNLDVNLGNANFVNNLTRLPTARIPRPGVATVQDFYQTHENFFVRKNISATSFCHAYNVWGKEDTIDGICFEKGTEQDTNSVSMLAALRSENYCSMRATHQPFVVHLLPVHRARERLAASDEARGCGFVYDEDANARVLEDFPIEGGHIQDSLKHYDLRKFMYHRYITILDAKLRDKIQPPTEQSQSPLERVLEFVPTLRQLEQGSSFRPECLDIDLYSNEECDSIKRFDADYDKCASDLSNSILYFLYQQMHCAIANSTQKLLQSVVDSAVAAVNENLPTFVDDPEVVVIDNPCNQSTTEAQLSINGGAWRPVANFGEAKQVTWQGSPQTLHVKVKTIDGECAFETSVVVSTTQRGIAFAEKSTQGKCDADMEHAREFPLALKRFDVLVAVA